MSTSNELETTNVVYEVYEGPDQRRCSRRLQGFPPAPDPLPTTNASSATHTLPRPSIITPQVPMPVPRHQVNQIPAAAPQQQPHQIQAQPEHYRPPPSPPPADPQIHIQPAVSAPPPPPPVAEIQLIHPNINGSQAGRPPRRLEFDNTGDAESNHSGLTYQGALGNVQPAFIDQRSLPPGTDHLSWPLRNNQMGLRHSLNNEVLHIKQELFQMQEQVHAIQNDVGSIRESTQRTDKSLQAITETNRLIQKALQAQQNDFRLFISTDLGTIIQGHL